MSDRTVELYELFCQAYTVSAFERSKQDNSRSACLQSLLHIEDMFNAFCVETE